MSGSTDTARDVYVTGLINQHAVENQARELLERQIGRLESYPEMVARMQQHLEETNQQAKRIEELLADLGTSHSSVKDTVMSFVGNMAAMMHAPAPDEVIKNSFANFAFENYEIASYKALITLADIAGHASAQSVLKLSLGEEQAMARWIDEHLEDTTRKFVSRKQSGQTAGR
jgi:ferritin-like metal-binding protein YciE